MSHPSFTRNIILLIIILFGITGFSTEPATDLKKCSVIAYYPWNGGEINQYPVEKLTHIIFSFVHIKGNILVVDNASDSLTIRKMIALKKRNPALKVILSLGGWGGCYPCSSVFSNPTKRTEFVISAKKLLDSYTADGLDLDWEFPAIEGYPGYPYASADRQNFTSLIRELRNVLGPGYEISFAAGGFTEYLSNSVEWDQVMPLVNRVNLMTYDLTNGFSKKTGHHTPLYSSSQQKESVDYGIRYLDSIGVPMQKIAIGIAFYARVWEKVPPVNAGLFQPGSFKTSVNYKNFASYFQAEDGFTYQWDSICNAPTYYSEKKQEFGTFDDIHSVTLKTNYALSHHLDGIMFWELTADTTANGLIDAINHTIETYHP